MQQVSEQDRRLPACEEGRRLAFEQVVAAAEQTLVSDYVGRMTDVCNYLSIRLVQV